MQNVPGPEQRRAALLAAEPAPASQQSALADEAPQPSLQRRGAAERLVTVCCACHSRALRNLDDFVLMGYELPRPLPAPVMRQVRIMRCPALSAAFAGAASMITQYACVSRGWDLLDEGVPEVCGWLHLWLLSYCWVLTVFPFCAAFAGPFVVAWGLLGLLLRSSLSTCEECQEKAPEVYTFVGEFMTLSWVTLAMTVLCGVILWYVRNQMKALHRMWGSSGPTEQEVVRRILAEVAVPPQAGSDRECSICLEGEADEERTEAGEAPRWRALRCGHAFHEHCLVEWLGHARRCPLCRLDLHAAYLRGGAGDVSIEAS